MNVLNYNDYIVEFFGFGKSDYDDLAKSTFEKLVDGLDTIKVDKYGDYKYQVIISDITKSNEAVVGLKRGNSSVPYSPPKSIKDVIKEPSYKGKIKIEVMKNYSKHRLSSKIFGKFRENTYSLSINGKHFVSEKRGEEGKLLVSNSITKKFWELLDEVCRYQEDLRKDLIDKEDYDDKINKLKDKY